MSFKKEEINITSQDIIPSHEAAIFSIQNQDVDVRPRFFDNHSNSWFLVDTGAQVSCCAPSPDDKVDPSIVLEAVDGSRMPCYGTKTLTFRIGRKTYHQQAFITNTSENILGMDFIHHYKMENRWSEYGDYYLYDKKSNI